MSGKPSLKSELVDQILEAVCFYDNFLEDIDSVLEEIEKNEQLDHDNDKLRHEAVGFLLNGLKSSAIPEGASANIHAAIQKLHSADGLDYKDDIPRNQAKLKLSLVREKAFNNRNDLERLLAVIGGNTCSKKPPKQ